MANFIVVIILLAITASAAIYIYKARKSGKKCIGCPDSGCCGKNEGSACSGFCGSCGGCSKH